MINPKTVDQIEKTSLEDRLEIIERILQTLKKDIKPKLEMETPQPKFFKIREFSLGAEVRVDPEILYSERG